MRLSIPECFRNNDRLPEDPAEIRWYQNQFPGDHESYFGIQHDSGGAAHSTLSVTMFPEERRNHAREACVVRHERLRLRLRLRRCSVGKLQQENTKGNNEVSTDHSARHFASPFTVGNLRATWNTVFCNVRTRGSKNAEVKQTGYSWRGLRPQPKSWDMIDVCLAEQRSLAGEISKSVFCPRIARMGANLNRGRDCNGISVFAFLRAIRAIRGHPCFRDRMELSCSSPATPLMEHD